MMIETRANTVKQGDRILYGNKTWISVWDVDRINIDREGMISFYVSLGPGNDYESKTKDVFGPISSHASVWVESKDPRESRPIPDDIYTQIEDCAREIVAHMGGHSVKVIPGGKDQNGNDCMLWHGTMFTLSVTLLGMNRSVRLAIGHGGPEPHEMAKLACEHIFHQAMDGAFKNARYSIRDRKAGV